MLGGVKFGTGDSDRLQEELDEGAEAAAASIPKHEGHDDDGPISGIHGHDLALGSGSTDFLIGTSAFYRSGRWYGSGDVQYALRRTGDFDYRFGNDLLWTLSAGRFLMLEHDRTISLQLNLSGENKDFDELAGQQLDDTHSRVLFLGPEMDSRSGRAGRWICARNFRSTPTTARSRRLRATGCARRWSLHSRGHAFRHSGRIATCILPSRSIHARYMPSVLNGVAKLPAASSAMTPPSPPSSESRP